MVCASTWLFRSLCVLPSAVRSKLLTRQLWHLALANILSVTSLAAPSLRILVRLCGVHVDGNFRMVCATYYTLDVFDTCHLQEAFAAHRRMFLH